MPSKPSTFSAKGRGPHCAHLSETSTTRQEETVVLEARDILSRYLSQNPVIGSSHALMDYYTLIVRGPSEHFHILYLDRMNCIMADELLSTGSVNHVPVYPRKVIKGALTLHDHIIVGAGTALRLRSMGKL